MLKNHRYSAAILITAAQKCLQYFVIGTINSNDIVTAWTALDWATPQHASCSNSVWHATYSENLIPVFF